MAQRMDDVEPKPGDLIEIPRGIFHHWAIYIGDGYVIHLTTANGCSFSHLSTASSGSTMTVLNETGTVKKERLFDVVGTDTFCVKNLLDDQYKPRSVSDILKDARSRVGQELPYNITRYNCEHFVTELRYGKPESRQVRDAAQMAEGAGAAAIGVGLLGVAAVAAVQFVKILFRSS